MNAAVRWLTGGRAESPPPTGTYKEERITPEDALRLLAPDKTDAILHTYEEVTIVGSEGRPWGLIHIQGYSGYLQTRDWYGRARCIDIRLPSALRGNGEKSAFALILGIQADEQGVHDRAG